MPDSPKGRRTGAVAYGTRGIASGAIRYIDADGFEQWLEYPAGAALGEYVLVTSDDDIPTWQLASSFTGPTPVTEPDGSGGFELVFDEDGSVILDG